MSRQCFSSRSLSGKRAGSVISSGFRGGNSLSSTCYTGAGKCGGYSNRSHYNFGRSRRLSGGGAGGYSASFRDLGLGRSGGVSTENAGSYNRAGGFSSQSLGAYGSGYSSGYRFGGFSSRSLGGSRGYRISGFGSQSQGGGGNRGIIGGVYGGQVYEPTGRFGGSRGIHGVRVNANLLRPLCIQVDPEISKVKEEEREQIKTLNDKFACFIDKVRHLEQQNKLLETKWNCLQQQEPAEKKCVEHLFENYIAALRRQLEVLLNEREQLQLEQAKFQDVVEEYKCRYEEEINRRMAAENEFVLLKKDVDCAYTSKVELEVKVETLRQELEFLRCFYEAELDSLQTTACDTSVIVSMDNNRELDMEGIINTVRCQYEEIVQKSKDEVNALYETKYQELQNTWGRHCDNLSSCRHEVQDLTRLVQRLRTDMENAKKQVDALQSAITDTEERGECALKDAKAKLSEVENALQRSKDELARLLRDYQELMNVKMALDIEIAMYKTLLEGEESRISGCTPVNISVVGCTNISSAGGPGFGGKYTYGPGPGEGYVQRYSSSNGRCSSSSGKLGYRSGYSSRSGGNLSKHTVSCGFGQSGTTVVGPCGVKDCGAVSAGSNGGGGFSSRSRGYSSRSGGYSSSGMVHVSSTSGCPTGTCGGASRGMSAGVGYSAGDESYTSGSSGSSYSPGVGDSGTYSPVSGGRAGCGGACSISR